MWKQGHELAIAARRATQRFPRFAYSSLQNQITRAAESIVLNIVEGSGAASQREFARFLDMAIRSSKEVEAQLELAKDYGVLSNLVWTELAHETVSIRRQLCTLRVRVLTNASAPTHPPAVKPSTSNLEPKTPNLVSIRTIEE